MKLFDLHADIGYDVMQKKHKGELQDILKHYHMKKLKAGEIAYVCMASFFNGSENWEYMQEMITSLRSEIDTTSGIDLVLSKDDLVNENSHMKAIMSVEGMCGIKDDVAHKIQWMYEQGIRIASLTWNEENALATGVRGNEEQGVSELGKQALEKMIELNMIIDVSHSNEKTFWDIMSYPDAHVIATHSNIRTLCNHPRNLSDEQAAAILERKGLIGMNSAPFFIHKTKEKQDIPHLIKHMEYLKKMQGSVEGIAFGFDFMDFYDEYEETCVGLEDCSVSQNMVNEMEQQGFSYDEIADISYRNAVEYLYQIL